MSWVELEEYDNVIEAAEDGLVASVVMLTAAIFVFSISALLMPLVSIGHSPVSGDFLVLSAAIITASVLISSVHVIKS